MTVDATADRDVLAILDGNHLFDPTCFLAAADRLEEAGESRAAAWLRCRAAKPGMTRVYSEGRGRLGWFWADNGNGEEQLPRAVFARLCGPDCRVYRSAEWGSGGTQMTVFGKSYPTAGAAYLDAARAFAEEYSHAD